MNLDDLRSDAENIDWSMLFDSQCIDEKISYFSKELNAMYDKYPPICQIKVKHLPAL